MRISGVGNGLGSQLTEGCQGGLRLGIVQMISISPGHMDMAKWCVVLMPRFSHSLVDVRRMIQFGLGFLRCRTRRQVTGRPFYCFTSDDVF